MRATPTSKALSKVWAPLSIAVILSVSAVAVVRLHNMFGADHSYTAGGPKLEEPRNLHPKHLLYEIFGPPHTTVSINYLDENANPQRADVTSLPWSIAFTMTPRTAALNIVAQGDSDYLGCRITVNDEVKDEYVARLAFAQTYCEVKTA